MARHFCASSGVFFRNQRLALIGTLRRCFRIDRATGASILDSYSAFVVLLSAQYPTLSEVRLLEMARIRGYQGGSSHFRARNAYLNGQIPSAHTKSNGIYINYIRNPKPICDHRSFKAPQHFAEKMNRLTVTNHKVIL